MNPKGYMTMKITGSRVLLGAAAAAGVLAVAGCSGTSITGGNAAESATSRQDLSTFEQVQPAPHFPYSDIRQTMIDVQASQALGEQTTSFFFNMGSRDPYFSCPSKGDPVPNTSELTNPSQVETWYGSGATAPDATAVVGNIDPNGLYAPTASDGTNVMCLSAAGTAYLVYAEGPVTTINAPAHWDMSTHQPVISGAPTMPSCKVEIVNGKKQSVCTK